MSIIPYYDKLLGALRESDANTGAIGETVTGGTPGSILFIDSSGQLAQNNSNLFWDDSNKRLGLTTNAPTHTLTLGSTSTGISLYNTSDQTTNYERVLGSWSSNTFKLLTQNGGTGSLRGFNLGVTGREQLRFSNSSPYTQIISGSSVASTNLDVQFTPTNSTGTAIFQSITGTITQSSSAAYTVLVINPTESSTGSGAKLLTDWQVGSASKAKMTNAGLLSFGSTATGLILNNQTDEVTNFEQGAIGWSANAFIISSLQGGTGTARALLLKQGTSSTISATLNVNSTGTGATAGNFYITRGTSGVNLNIFAVGTGSSSMTQSSGVVNMIVSQPNINQSGTAGYNVLLINPTETATGSGAKNLILVQVGGVDKVKIDNTGLITTVSTTLMATSASLTDGASVSLGTLTNAPTAGNPTKWIPISDNSTTRYIPAW